MRRRGSRLTANRRCFAGAPNPPRVADEGQEDRREAQCATTAAILSRSIGSSSTSGTAARSPAPAARVAARPLGRHAKARGRAATPAASSAARRDGTLRPLGVRGTGGGSRHGGPVVLDFRGLPDRGGRRRAAAAPGGMTALAVTPLARAGLRAGDLTRRRARRAPPPPASGAPPRRERVSLARASLRAGAAFAPGSAAPRRSAGPWRPCPPGTGGVACRGQGASPCAGRRRRREARPGLDGASCISDDFT
jgi:hypothetical protein